MLLIGALLAVVIINQGCIDSCLTAVLAARLKAADILAVRVTTVRDGTADLSARVGLRGVTLLVSSATLPVPSIGRESSARGRNIMMEKRNTRSILALRGCGFRGLDYLLLRASLIVS